MTDQLFDEQALPLEDLEKIGLAKNGRLILAEDDLRALLSGRRTDMVRLANLTAEGIHILAMDAKLSLKQNTGGNLDLLIHPIYRKAEYAEYLTDTEAEMLEKGEAANILKRLSDTQGNETDILVEFDTDTNEFIITDTEKIMVPDFVNNEKLTLEQKERYRKGKEVELKDGTKFQYSGTEKKGISSNKLALVASILIDGGVSYLLFKGLNALFSEKSDQKDRTHYGKGYHQALKDMQAKEKEEKEKGHAMEFQNKNEYSRGYSRSGIKR
jgi:hypothetical protein